MLLELVEKTKQTYVLPFLAKYVYIIARFDLWMSKAHDVFTMVVIFGGEDWMPKHIIISLFQTLETLGQALAKRLQDLLKQYGLIFKDPSLC
jgi:hypothetical protein